MENSGRARRRVEETRCLYSRGAQVDGSLRRHIRSLRPARRRRRKPCAICRDLTTQITGSDENMVTTNYVLVETFALVQSRLGLEAVREFQESIVPVLSVEFVTPETHRLGIAALLAASRRGLSLVDCVSFEVMRDLGIKRSLRSTAISASTALRRFSKYHQKI